MKYKWHKTAPKQKWLVIYGIGAKCSDLIGVSVYGDMQNYWYSYFPGVMGSIYFLTVFYTLWYYFVRGEFARGMQSTCPLGMVCSVS